MEKWVGLRDFDVFERWMSARVVGIGIQMCWTGLR